MKSKFLLILLFAIAQGAWAWSGAGTEDDPFLIESDEDWSTLVSNIENGETYEGKFLKLTPTTLTVHKPAGTSDYPFSGTIDGNWKRVVMEINDTETGGTALFRFAKNATIKNMTTYSTLTGTWFAASLVGFASGEVNITCCRIRQGIQGEGTVGGLVGCAENATLNINGCIFDGLFQSTNNRTIEKAGGVVGVASNSTIKIRHFLFKAYDNTGETSALHPIGFIAPGTTVDADVSCCLTLIGKKNADTDIIADSEYTPAYTISSVTGIQVSIDGTPVVYNSSINGYESAITIGTTIYVAENKDIPLVIRPSDGFQAEDFTTDHGTLTQTSEDHYTLSGIDGNVTVSGTVSFLEWAGSGTKEDPYIISSPTALELLSQRVCAGESYEGYFFKMTADITFAITSSTRPNFTPIGFSSAGNVAFNGNFDGDGHTISQLYIYNPDYQFQSLFASLDANAVVQNLIIKGSTMRGKASVAAVAGQNKGIISNVIVSSTRICGENTIGGVVGQNLGGTVTNCHVLSDCIIYCTQANGVMGGIAATVASNGLIDGCCSVAANIPYDNNYTGLLYGGIAAVCTKSSVKNSLYLANTVQNAQNTGTVVSRLNNSSTLKNNYYTQAAGNDDVTDNDGTVAALRDNADNSTAIALLKARDTFIAQYGFSDPVTVEIYGRTLYKDTKWNTLCLPFNLRQSQLANLAGTDGTVKRLSSSDFSEGTLTLNFNDATDIPAGTPFLVKWEEGEDIESPQFTGVTFTTTEAAPTTTKYTNFTGTFKPVELEAGDTGKLFLGSDNKLYYPDATFKISAFKGYFILQGIQAGTLENGGNAIKSMFLNFDGEYTPTTIQQPGLDQRTTTTNVWYDLTGRQYPSMPSTPGIYIYNNKKFLIHKGKD